MTTLAEIKAYRPKDLDEALECMRSVLDFFHPAVHQAIHQRGRYSKRIFFDAEWIKRLAGKFSLLYFQSLSTEERPGERAWMTAHPAGRHGPDLGLPGHVVGAQRSHQLRPGLRHLPQPQGVR